MELELKLFNQFVKDNELFEFCDELYQCLYWYAVDDFTSDVVYYKKPELAVNSWIQFVDRWINELILTENYKAAWPRIIVEEIDTILERFIEWLRTLDETAVELDAELVIKLLTGEIIDRDVALGSLGAHLRAYCAQYCPTKEN